MEDISLAKKNYLISESFKNRKAYKRDFPAVGQLCTASWLRAGA